MRCLTQKSFFEIKIQEDCTWLFWVCTTAEHEVKHHANIEPGQNEADKFYQQIDVRLFVGIIVVEYAGLTDIVYDNHFDD